MLFRSIHARALSICRRFGSGSVCASRTSRWTRSYFGREYRVFFLDIFFAETSRGGDETRLSVPLVARPPCHRTCLYARDLRGLRGSPARTSRRRSCVCRSCFTSGNRLQSLLVSGRCSLSSGREAPSGNPTSFGSGLVALDLGRSLCSHGCGLGTTTSALISFAFSCVRLLRSALRRFLC